MTSHVARLYATAVALVVFFVGWAVVAAHPWVTRKAAVDPALAALTAREQRVRAESVAVKKLLDKRWRAYRIALAARQQAIAAQKQQQLVSVASAAPAPAASPGVRVVTLPPLTITRTS